ncbi:Adenylate cyclase, class 3 [Pedococcus cremeus]|uniref:Adenylate cyclase, class 3 n=1 Tax=Pedococcus cremeus TaxID=587636 RepID=A0A1H9RRN5_9MICO|nr:adenylate/guanylate cyclase domain-containing protein [Pedococcus cremeus]SER75472.1 Adenylate cyclase, class 3 [Pedococcus cremeus]
MEPQTRYARSGDVSIAYQVVGEGPHDVVVAPGFISHVELSWEQPALRRFLTRLAAFSRLVVFDKRGTGLSDPVASAPTLEERADDLRAVMDAAGMERAAVLGISEGGTMALMFAAGHPERTSALVLYGTWARLGAAPDYPEGVDPELLAGLVRLVDRWGTGVGLSAWAPSRRDDQQLRDWWGRLQRSSASPAMARTLFSSYPDLDARCLLPTIQAPALVLHRRGDQMVPLALGRYLAAHLPHARLVELPGDDHLFFVGDTDTVLDEIELFLTGARPAQPVDRVVTTLLFTDVVGSTALAAELGDQRWRELLEGFKDAVSREVERGGGRVVDFAGDGALAAFDGPARAIRCGLGLHKALAPLGLSLRVGVHTGEVEQLRGGDLGGLAVHLAARIMAEAAAGEVLVSSTVRDLVVGSGIGFTPRGTRVLKGIPGEWSLLAVDA